MKELSNQEKKRLLIKKGMGILAAQLKEKLPEKGSFITFNAHAELPGTEYCMVFTLEHDRRKNGGEGRWVKASLRPKNSDRLSSHYLINGSSKELISWLSEEKNAAEFEKSFDELFVSME